MKTRRLGQPATPNNPQIVQRYTFFAACCISAAACSGDVSTGPSASQAPTLGPGAAAGGVPAPGVNPMVPAGPGVAVTGVTPVVPGTHQAPVATPAVPPVAAPAVPAPPVTAAPERLPWPVHSQGRTSSLRRLSRTEIATSLEVLTGVPADFTNLPTEPRAGGHGLLRTAGLSLSNAEFDGVDLFMRRFADGAAGTVLGNTGCAEQGDAQASCLLDWAVGFVPQAQRRDASDADRALFTKLLSTADGTQENDMQAVADVLYVNFISPLFVYRTEIGIPVAGQPELRQLTPLELAARLSFLAYQGPPDAALVQAAKGGLLASPDERLAHFDRLRATSFGQRAVEDFFLEWLRGTDSPIGAKAPNVLGDLGNDFDSAITASARATITEVVNSADPTIANLFTTSSYLEHPAVQAITRGGDVNGVTTGDTAITARQGILMHPYFLSVVTVDNGFSPMQFGVFIKETPLCELVPIPPDNAADLANENPPDGLGLVAELEFRSNAAPACVGCHATFNELGFTHAPFDSLGRWINEDPFIGGDWNLNGTAPTFGGQTLTFTSPSDLHNQLSTLPQVRGCVAQAATEYALGRGLIPRDRTLVERVFAVTQQGGGDIGETFRTIVASPEFSFASAPEVSQ